MGDPKAIYERLNDMGYKFGPTFRSISSFWVENDQLLALVDVPGEVNGMHITNYTIT